MRCYNLAAALILLSQASGTQAELEIWLASTLNCNSCACNSCAIFSEVAQRRGYGDVLRYDHSGTELDIPIRQVDKRDLDTAILGQLSDGDGPHGPWWDVTLLVLMVDHGHVLAAGNIAQSADVRELRHEPEVMFPPDVPPEGHPSLSEESLYHPFFVREWNLEHFVRIALGSEPKVRSRRASLARDHPPPDPMTPERLIDLTAGDPVAMRPANVILWGSADKPLSNALFISRRIAEIRSTLKALRLDGVQFLTMYGHGPRVPGNDTSYLEDGRVRFQRADLAADLSASGTSMNRVLTGIGESRRSRTLLIQVGHSGPAGSPLWGGGSTLMPGDIAPIRQNPDADLVMISGGCHSGLFAPAVQCGFFAAHPEVKAAGCQLSAQALETSDDSPHRKGGRCDSWLPGIRAR
jgi:hypothetical protein